MNLDLVDFNNDKPIKVIQLSFDNDSKKVEIKRTLTFLKDQSAGIKNILLKIEDNKDLTSKEKETLIKNFGSNWKESLGINNLLGKKGIQVAGADEEVDEELDTDDFIDPEPEPESEPEEGSKSSTGVNILDILEKDSASDVSTTDFIIDTDMSDTTVTDMDIFKKLVVSEDSTDVNIKHRKKINFVYDIINFDDNIRTIKDKIYIATKIDHDSQHLFYFQKKSDSYKVKNLEYMITNNEFKNIVYNTNITNLFSNYHKLKKTGLIMYDSLILDIPMDKNFYNKYYKKRQYSIQDISNKLLNEFSEFNNEIYIVDFKDILKTHMRIQLRNMEQSKISTFINSFVVKYFPMIYNHNKLNETLDESNLKNYNSASFLKQQKFKINQKLIDVIYEIDSKSIKKDIKLGAVDYNLIQLFIKINFNTSNKKIFINRNLFNFYETNEIIPFMRFKDTVNKVVFNKFKIEHINNILKDKWIEKQPNGISFKLRFSDKKSSPLYNRFASVELHDDGKIDIKCNWKDDDNTTFEMVKQVISLLNDKISEINSLHNYTFIRGNRIRLSDSNNTNYNHITITSVINNYKYDTNEFIKLFSLFSLFKAFVNAIPSLSKIFKDSRTIYLRYIRASCVVSRCRKRYNRSYNAFVEKEIDEEAADDTPYNKIGVEVRLINIGDNNVKIIIKGSHNTSELNNIYNFILRILYINKDTKNRLPEHLYKDYQKLYNKNKKGIINKNLVLKSIPSKLRIRKLQSVDPVLFNYPISSSKKYSLYSKLCQGKYQPLPLTDQELLNYSKDDYTYATRFPNQTRKNEYVNYICTHKNFKYPGFIKPYKHPKNLCMPCCYKSSAKVPDSKNYSVYMKCLNKDMVSFKSSNKNYILQYGKLIHVNRYGNLHRQLDIILNGNVKPDKNSYLDKKKASIYLLFGIQQNRIAFINSFMMALGVTSDEIDSLDFIGYLSDKLNDQPKIFYSLENGDIKRAFSTIDNYINYLKNSLVLDYKLIKDLLIKCNGKFNNKINLIVFESINDNIHISCDLEYKKFVGGLDNPSYRTILILKYKNWFCPLVFIPKSNLKMLSGENIESVLYSDVHQSLFKHDHEIIPVIKDLYSVLCTNSNINTSFFDKYNFNLMNKKSEIMTAIKTNDRYKIIAQIINDNQQITNLILHDNKVNRSFTIPIRYSSMLTKVKVTDMYIQGDYKDILNWFKFAKSSALYYTPEKIIVNNDHLHGFILDTKYTIYINKIKLKDASSDIKKLPKVVMGYDHAKVNAMISKGISTADARVTTINKYKYKKEIYELLRLEISEVLINERNNNIRKKISDLINDHGNLTDLHILKQKIKELVGSVDYKNLDNLIVITFNTDLNIDNLKNIIDTTQFNFDKSSIKEIVGMVEECQKSIKITSTFNKNRNKLVKLLEDIIKDHVKITPFKDLKSSIPSIINSNIRFTCKSSKNECMSDTKKHCSWENKRCVLQMTQKDFNFNIQRVTDEIIHNNIKLFELTTGGIDKIKNKELFEEFDDEEIITVPIGPKKQFFPFN